MGWEGYAHVEEPGISWDCSTGAEARVGEEASRRRREESPLRDAQRTMQQESDYEGPWESL